MVQFRSLTSSGTLRWLRFFALGTRCSPHSRLALLSRCPRPLRLVLHGALIERGFRFPDTVLFIWSGFFTPTVHGALCPIGFAPHLRCSPHGRLVFTLGTRYSSGSRFWRVSFSACPLRSSPCARLSPKRYSLLMRLVLGFTRVRRCSHLSRFVSLVVLGARLILGSFHSSFPVLSDPAVSSLILVGALLVLGFWAFSPGAPFSTHGSGPQPLNSGGAREGNGPPPSAG